MGEFGGEGGEHGTKMGRRRAAVVVIVRGGYDDMSVVRSGGGDYGCHTPQSGVGVDVVAVQLAILS